MRTTARALVVTGLASAVLALAPGAWAAPKDRVVVTLLQTSDLHVNLLPWDYARGQEAPVGLARVATRIKGIRATTPNVLLLDAGDTIQGTPIGFLHAKGKTSGPNPMSVAMSLLRYDAMAVGNHEFNFGLDVLRRAQKDASFPWLSANTRNADGSPAFPEYVVKSVAGVRIGVLGMVSPNIPNWEPEPNRKGLTWEDPVDTAKRLVPVLRGKERCDFVVVLIHSGPEVDLATGEANGTAHENRVAALAKGAPGIDLILSGHTHRKIPLTRLSGVPIIQPGRWGEALARVDVAFEKKGKAFAVASVTGDLLLSDATVAVDAEVAAIAKPHHDAALAWLGEPLARSSGPFPAERARLEDSALLDLIADTMLDVTKADLAMTSLLPGSPRYAGLPEGTITARDVYGLYPYENQLVVVEVTGSILKDCLERAAEFYGEAVWKDGRLVLTPQKGMIPYNFDAVQGATYRLDPTAPVGSRVKELRVKGKPVAPEDRFTLAVNGYRAQGAGGYAALKRAKLLREYPDEIRELVIARLRDMKVVSPVFDRNWIAAPDVVWSEVSTPPAAAGH